MYFCNPSPTAGGRGGPLTPVYQSTFGESLSSWFLKIHVWECECLEREGERGVEAEGKERGAWGRRRERWKEMEQKRDGKREKRK